MNKQTISLSRTRVSRIFALALPVSVLFLAQACNPRPRYGINLEAIKSNSVAASEMASSVESHSLKK